MALLDEDAVRARARRRADSEGLSVEEAMSSAARRKEARFDVFLSQTVRDAEVVLGVYDLLTEQGLVVFCDWIAAPHQNRSAVTPANAEAIRQAMAVSDTLLFLDTERSDQSLWMCWELGWFDGGKGRVAVLPVLSTLGRHYRAREFLGLYPYVELDENGRLRVVRPEATSQSGITLFEAPNSTSFDRWRIGPLDGMRPRILDMIW